MIDFKSEFSNVDTLSEAEQLASACADIKPPTWYTEDEIRDWLLHKNYSKQIAIELAMLITQHYQHAFVKGFQKAYIKFGLSTGRQLPKLEAERLAWSLNTFSEATPVSSLRKLEGEIREVEADLATGDDPTEEYADCLMCLFDSAGRVGISVEQITEAFRLKLEKNKARTWVKNSDNSYSHVK